ncbi:P-loop containing nucleoside triphosphate hydrolase protein, partial [Leptodontidium sp. 2 PMI_412]
MIDPFAYFQFKNHDGLLLHPLGLPAPIIHQPVYRPHHGPPPPPGPPLGLPHPHHPPRIMPPPLRQTEDLFENLVLLAEEKDLLLALAKSHCDAKAKTFDDFVIGKGRGIVILLDGPPGIGKTLTAESVAETIKAPLYTISAGELGSQSYNNAVLLIDEADIFMEQRTPYELDRNELVAIFLRHMEYFHGVMILTTNR